MPKRISYASHVRVPDGRVASIDALASGLARVAFADKTTKLVAKSSLTKARNNVDRKERPPRKMTDSERAERSTRDSIAVRGPESLPVARATVLAGVCEALGLDPRKARQRLRKAGLRAPYDNEDQLMKVLRK